MKETKNRPDRTSVQRSGPDGFFFLRFIPAAREASDGGLQSSFFS